MPSDRESAALSALLGNIYDAALDPTQWPSVLEKVCGFVDAAVGNLFSHDVINQTADVHFIWGDDPYYTNLYLEKLAATNPLFPATWTFPVGEVVSISDIIPLSQMYESRVYTELMQPQGYVDAAAINVDKTATSVTLMVALRHQRHGLVDHETRRRLALLAPHVRRAVLVGKAIDLKTIKARTFEETIDGLTTGVFLLSSRGAVVHANASARAMLEARDPLTVVQGTILAADENTQRKLYDMLSAAKRGDAASSDVGAVLTLSARTGDYYSAHVLPLAAGDRLHTARQHAAVAALFVRKVAVDVPAAVAAATQLYGFTPAESRVLRAVIEVGGVVQVAQLLGVGKRTVTTHLERIFRKTGVNRQTELVKLIAGYESPVLSDNGT